MHNRKQNLVQTARMSSYCGLDTLSRQVKIVALNSIKKRITHAYRAKSGLCLGYRKPITRDGILLKKIQMSELFVNKVAESGLISFDLEAYYPKGEIKLDRKNIYS